MCQSFQTLQLERQRRAAVAATFAASLELARSGIINLRQDGLFGPIYMKRAEQQPATHPSEVTHHE